MLERLLGYSAIKCMTDWWYACQTVMHISIVCTILHIFGKSGKCKHIHMCKVTGHPEGAYNNVLQVWYMFHYSKFLRCTNIGTSQPLNSIFAIPDLPIHVEFIQQASQTSIGNNCKTLGFGMFRMTKVIRSVL